VTQFKFLCVWRRDGTSGGINYVNEYRLQPVMTQRQCVDNVMTNVTTDRVKQETMNKDSSHALQACVM